MRGYRSLLAAIGLAASTLGCAVTDYNGHSNHRTVDEAKLFALEVAFSTGDPELDGTYAYTVEYDNHGGRDPQLRIVTYRNAVFGSFSRDGIIDRDGDDVKNASGILGGKYQTRWSAVDPQTGCGFFNNIVQFRGPAPTITSCIEDPAEEIDRDFELQASFASFGDLMGKIWSGAVDGEFVAVLERVTLNGVEVPLDPPLPIPVRSTGMRPMQPSLDLTGPAGAALVQAVLDHTRDGEPATVSLGFAGGMSIELPLRLAFDHEGLARLR